MSEQPISENPAEENAFSADTVEKAHEALESVEAHHVSMTQSSAGSIKAETVEIVQGGVQSIEAQSVTLENGGVIVADCGTLNITYGSVGIASAQQVQTDGLIGVLATQSIDMTDARSGVVIAREVRGESIRTVFLFSGKVEGNVETVVDQRNVALLGLAAGLGLGLMITLGRLFGRKR